VALSVAAAVLVGATVYHGGDNLKQAWGHTTQSVGHAGKAGLSTIGVGVEEEAPQRK
jgi:hypothetical protein